MPARQRPPPPAPSMPRMLAAIDVGTNAVRLELARITVNGTLEVVHQERDPVRPGEGLYKTGAIQPVVADRLLATLRRYATLCRRYNARVRAVATSAVREARNRDEIVRRVRDEAGILLEVVSGREEARLICVGVLHGSAPLRRSLCIDIGGGSTEVALGVGEHPKDLWSTNIGAVRMSEMFSSGGDVSPKRLRLMRHYALETFKRSIPARISGAPAVALGSSGTIGAVVAFASRTGASLATAQELSRAVDVLGGLSHAKRKKRLDPKRADIIVGGAVVLEALVHQLGLTAVQAVDRGLRDGILVDLLRREAPDLTDASLSDAAIAFGRRFHWDEPHAMFVTRTALKLFDALRPVHQLPAAVRPLLEVAALLHEIGMAVGATRHHKHAQYLIQNADIPGISDRERELAALIARYHRRAPPNAGHVGMVGLSPAEFRTVRGCAALLRISNCLDSSHMQPLQDVAAKHSRSAVALELRPRGPIDLELWDLEKDLPFLESVFGLPIKIVVQRAR